MFSKRIKVFILLAAALLLICLASLVKMQLLSGSYYLERIAELKQEQSHSRQLKTIRGKILDRNGSTLAADMPQFLLCINYTLSSFMDTQHQQAMLLNAEKEQNPDLAITQVQQEIDAGLEELDYVIEKCVLLGLNREEIKERIKQINDQTWNLRLFLAWRRNCLDNEILKKYDGNINNIPLSVAIADFAKKLPDDWQRLSLIAKVTDIAEMNKDWPLLELNTNDDIFTAQLEFMDSDGIRILSNARRFYPYQSAAAQTIGWVGSAKGTDQELFASDKLLSYLDEDVCGREDGTEYVFETVLRGRRGELVYDIDRNLKSRTETQFGKDIRLTLDIALQQKIEKHLLDHQYNPNCKSPITAAVIDVTSGDILALVSLPAFDLNRIRYDYAQIQSDPNSPLLNRAINKQYPPGSVVKPVILIAALESGKITATEVIPCPAQKAPKGWPSCWRYNRYRLGHDGQWDNNAHNAIKGSCNIYFSHLANRLDAAVLQRWLFNFGFGRKILHSPPITENQPERNLRQLHGTISSGITNPNQTISDFNQVPILDDMEKRWFGIGQGNLRVTPLQVANTMAALARGGLYKHPRLYIDYAGQKSNSEIDLKISHSTLQVVRDAMYAVVNETGGTANSEFVRSGLAKKNIDVYGKTGSTEGSVNAWFAGFAEDSRRRAIALALIVEGGEHGSSDAAPLAYDIIQFCIDAGYIGQDSPVSDRIP